MPAKKKQAAKKSGTKAKKTTARKRTGNEDLIPIKLEGATLESFTPVRGRTNFQGDEISPPRMRLAFLVDFDRIEGLLNRIGGIYKKSKAITLALDFPEQLTLDQLKPHPGDSRPNLSAELEERAKQAPGQQKLTDVAAAEKNGHDTAKSAEIKDGEKVVDLGKRKAKKDGTKVATPI